MVPPERFRKTLFGGGAKSTLGYKVLFNSPIAIEYSDAVSTVFVAAEPLDAKMALALYPEEMTIGSPGGPRLADEDRGRLVLGRVRGVGRFLGWTLN